MVYGIVDMTGQAGKRVREVRVARGLTQVALARAARVSRQTVNAIEAGRSVPAVDVALRVAQVLECSVEELFGAAPMGPDVVVESTTRSWTGRVALAHLGGRWVSYPLQRESLRLSGDGLVRGAGGKRGTVEATRSLDEARDNVVLMGCAAGLGVLAEYLNARRGPGRFLWFSCSSTAALEELARDRSHVAGMHLVDPRTGDPNVSDARRLSRGKALVLIALARWQAGLVTALGNPKRLRTVADLGRRGLRIAVRERGSGAHRLLERELGAASLPKGWVAASSVRARSHLEVAQAVAIGAADGGVATRDAALAYGLEFVPLAEERYDLALAPDSLGDPRIKRLLDGLTSSGFRRELSSLGYDVSISGDRVAELAAS